MSMIAYAHRAEWLSLDTSFKIFFCGDHSRSPLFLSVRKEKLKIALKKRELYDIMNMYDYLSRGEKP